MSHRLTVSPRNQDGVIILELIGDLDVYTLPKLKDAIEILADQPQRGIIIDLSQVSYVDSSAIGYFITFDGKIKTGLCGIALAGPGLNVRQTLERMHIHKKLAIHLTCDAALQSFLHPGGTAQAKPDK